MLIHHWPSCSAWPVPCYGTIGTICTEQSGGENMDNRQPTQNEESRDARTGEGTREHSPEGRDLYAEARVDASAQDPANAVNAMSTPSDYSMLEIERGQTPLDED